MEASIVQTIARMLRRKPSILFITGAGVSADSGLPTYRGKGGLYQGGETSDGFTIEEILSAKMLRENPALTWKYTRQIWDAAKSAKPNRAHEVISEIESAFPRVWTLTQNVDGLHTEAGSRNVIEIHGNHNKLFCVKCQATFLTRNFEFTDEPEGRIPKCSNCEGALRPKVVLFDEQLPQEALDRLRQQVQIGFSVVICVGTSALFPYIKDAVIRAKKQGNQTVEINPTETALSWVVDYRIEESASVALDSIWQAFKG